MSKCIRFCVSGSFSPADSATDWSADLASGDFENATLTLSGVLDDAGRQSDKVDLGLVRPREWDLYGCVDLTGESPTAGATVEYYWAPSDSATQANSNTAGNSGADADAPGGAVPSGLTLDEFLDQCIFIGALVVSNDAAVFNAYVDRFAPPSRWGQLIVVNRTGDTFEADDVEAHQLLKPVG